MERSRSRHSIPPLACPRHCETGSLGDDGTSVRGAPNVSGDSESCVGCDGGDYRGCGEENGDVCEGEGTGPVS